MHLLSSLYTHNTLTIYRNGQTIPNGKIPIIVYTTVDTRNKITIESCQFSDNKGLLLGIQAGDFTLKDTLFDKNGLLEVEPNPYTFSSFISWQSRDDGSNSMFTLEGNSLIGFSNSLFVISADERYTSESPIISMNCVKDNVVTSSTCNDGIYLKRSEGNVCQPMAKCISPAPTYNIALNECNFIPGITNIGTATCTFDANGDTGHVVDSVLNGPDCLAANTNDGLTQVNPDFISNGETSTYAVSVSIENSALEAGDTSVAFCIETSVKAGGSNDTYAQLGQRVKLDLLTDGSFSSNLTSAAVADGISAVVDSLDTTLTVNAYHCDASGASTSRLLSLDDTMYICIDGDQDIVIIDAIDNLQATKSGVSSLRIIDDGSIANEAITTIYDPDTNKAIVTIKLPFDFFKTSDAVTVSGNAEISAGGSGRQLSMSRSVVDQGADSTKFNIKVGVIPVSDPNSAARVPQAFKISAAAVFASLIMFWW